MYQKVSSKKITRTVKVKGEPVDKGGKCTMERKSPRPHTVTGKGECVHGFCFLALWWWLYSGKSDGRAILYSKISDWALPRFLSGSQVSSAAEYPFHLIRNVR